MKGSRKTVSLVCGEVEREVKGFYLRCQTGHGEEPAVVSQLAEQALSLYDLPRNSSVHLISRSENETYKIEAPSGRRWALRLQRPGYQSIHSLASEIAWLVALRKDGVVATPVPIAGLNGEWVQTRRGNSKTWFFLNGKTATNPRSAWICASVSGPWGRSPRRCMRTAETWQRPDGFERFTWNFETALGEAPRWGRWRDGLGMNATRLDLFGRTAELIRERLARYGSAPGSLWSGSLRLAPGQFAAARKRSQSDRLR